MRLLGTLLAGLLAGGAVTASGYAVAAAEDGADPVSGPGTVTITLTIRDSRFSPEHVRVWAGTQVRFMVRNRDPIGHELVVGPESVHLRHARGSEAAHPPVPGEVSVGPGQTGATVYEFEDPGDLRFVCHLPRHEDFGMAGVVEVLPRPT